MGNQLTSNAEAMRLFFTDDVYLVKSDLQISQAIQTVDLPKITAETEIATVITELPVSAINAANVEHSPERTWTFEYLGKNQKGILILVNDEVNKVSSTQGTELLRKLVKAIELTNNDFALLNYANYKGASFEEFYEFFNCQLVLSFGVEAIQLGLAPLPLHLVNSLGTTRLIFTTNLQELDTDQASKKTLWATLQTVK